MFDLTPVFRGLISHDYTQASRALSKTPGTGVHSELPSKEVERVGRGKGTSLDGLGYGEGEVGWG